MTEASAVSSPRSPTAEPTRRVGRRWVALIALANLGLYLGYIGPISVLLPNQVQAIAGSAGKVAALGWVTGIGAVVAFREVAGPEAEVVEAAAIRRNLTWTARKFWIRFPKKPVAESTKFLKSRRSIKFTTASPRNCARSTTSATLPTRAMPNLVITRSAWRRNRKI